MSIYLVSLVLDRWTTFFKFGRLTDERRVSLIPIADFQIVVVTISLIGGWFNPEGVTEIDPHEVAKVRGDGPEARDVRRVILRVHRAVELQRARVAVGEIFTILFK